MREIILNLQSVTKCFAKSKKIEQNWARPENVDICFCVSFDRYYQKLMFGGETRHKPMTPPNF